jgi:hypothetical protein
MYRGQIVSIVGSVNRTRQVLLSLFSDGLKHTEAEDEQMYCFVYRSPAMAVSHSKPITELEFVAYLSS